MDSGAFKTVIIGFILVVLAFMLGSQTVESTKNAAMMLAGGAGLFLLLVAGRRCWWLLFILPPLMAVAPLGALKAVPPPFLLAAVVLVYWLIMWSMGYVRLAWNGAIWVDLLVGLFFAYIVASYVRNPVSIGVLTDDLETGDVLVGGKAYVLAVGAVLYYLLLSILPLRLPDLHQALKFAYLARFVGVLLGAILAHFSAEEALADRLDEGRVSGTLQLGAFIIISVACAWPLSRILLSPWRLGLLGVGFLGVLLSGFRSQFVLQAGAVAYMALVWRQCVLALLVGCAALGVIYTASSSGLLHSLPYGAQRALYILPGVDIERGIAGEAQHSSDWRFEMWEWALDPRTGYIKDYVWGDGMGLSSRELQLQNVNISRGRVNYGNNEYFAERRLWHSGVISSIQDVGIVGLVMILMLYAAGIIMFWRIASRLRGSSLGFFIMFFTLSIVPSAVGYFASAGTLRGFMTSFVQIALLKLVYSLMQREGMLEPLFQRRSYIPLAIREHEKAVGQGGGSALRPATGAM